MPQLHFLKLTPSRPSAGKPHVQPQVSFCRTDLNTRGAAGGPAVTAPCCALLAAALTLSQLKGVQRVQPAAQTLTPKL